jgi:hypothetical protein
MADKIREHDLLGTRDAAGGFHFERDESTARPDADEIGRPDAKAIFLSMNGIVPDWVTPKDKIAFSAKC